MGDPVSEPVKDPGDLRSHEELLRYLEQLSGRTLRTHEDIRKYVEELSSRKLDASSAMRGWQMVKTGALIVLLVLATLQYYFLDVLGQIVSLHSVTVFVPVTTPLFKSNLEWLSVFV